LGAQKIDGFDLAFGLYLIMCAMHAHPIIYPLYMPSRCSNIWRFGSGFILSNIYPLCMPFACPNKWRFGSGFNFSNIYPLCMPFACPNVKWLGFGIDLVFGLYP